jgi:hypothetical protein
VLLAINAQQHVDYVGMTVLGRQGEGGGAVKASGVGAGSGGEEALDDASPPTGTGGHDGGVAANVHGGQVGTLDKKCVDNVAHTAGGREHQHRRTVLPGGVHVGTGLHELMGNGTATVLARDEESSHAILVLVVNCGTRRQ